MGRGNLNGSTLGKFGDAMSDRIFDQRLKDQTRNLCQEQLVWNIQGTCRRPANCAR